jgi:hypothetical protein
MELGYSRSPAMANSRNRAGSRMPDLAHSMIFLATVSAIGSVVVGQFETDPLTRGLVGLPWAAKQI